MGNDHLTPRSRWVAYGDLHDPGLAIDGDSYTSAVSNASYKNASLTIDLGKTCLFNMVAIDHGPDRFAFARKVAVLTSSDGKKFQPQMLVPGLRQVTTIVLIKQVLARYVRLQVVAEGDRPWSVAEVYLY